MDIEKELLQLKQRIASLETLKNVLFGGSYSSAGSSSSDYLIKTRGKIKIQIGNKFIDLLKDGEINVDSKFIFKEKEVGSKDGIYIIGDGEGARVIISIGGSLIDLKGEIGTTYISFLGALETTSEQKHTALQNIGFLYLNISDVQSNGLKTGIVYVESELKLYIVQDGQLTEFTIDFPNPYPKLFVISKTDKDKGALVIKGSGMENSLAFDSLLLYSSRGDTYMDSSGEIYIRIGEEEKILIGESQVVFSNRVISQTFQSKNATLLSGFRLYVDLNLNLSTLEVDSLAVRNSFNLIPKGSIIMFNGLSSEIPDGWHICDGTDGTPNLIGKFIKASNTSGNIGGNSEINILLLNLPSHTHKFTDASITTSENGLHSHSYTIWGNLSSAGDSGEGWYEVTKEDEIRTTSENGAHTHTLDMSKANLEYVGDNVPIEWEPTYYSLIYIMKIK